MFLKWPSNIMMTVKKRLQLHFLYTICKRPKSRTQLFLGIYETYRIKRKYETGGKKNVKQKIGKRNQ
jgi:hypothetical protein